MQKGVCACLHVCACVYVCMCVCVRVCAIVSLILLPNVEPKKEIGSVPPTTKSEMAASFGTAISDFTACKLMAQRHW